MTVPMTIREGRKEDVPILLNFIKQLAKHEGLPGKVIATEKLLREQLFSDPIMAHFIIAEINRLPIGYALYFYTFSTYLGRKCLYLEDLFVKPEVRGKGYGFALFKHIAQIAGKENCGRMEWSVVKRNEPAIKFYTKMGAAEKKDHTGYCLDGDALFELTKE